MREQAVELARRGFPVFRARGKYPLEEGWQDEATTDPDKVYSRWTCPVFGNDQGWNIGIATGRRLPNGLFLAAIDEDNKDGKTGAASLEMLAAIYDEPMPDTFRTRTPTAGRHHLVGTPRPIPNSVESLAPGIDVRGEGGYVIGPGSVREIGVYEIDNDADIAPAPKYLTKLAFQPKPKLEAKANIELDTTAAIERATDYLLNRAPSALEFHGGNNTTYKVFAKLREIGVSEQTAIELAAEHWNETKADPPWSIDELATICANAFKHGQNAPGSAMPENEFEAVAVKDVLRGGIEIEPVVKFDALDIPKRQWVLGTFAAKQYLSGLVSPPGVGKTTFLLMLAVAIATGRDDIVKLKVHQRGRVLLWNQEDETNELKRRLLAVMVAFDVKWSDIEDEKGKPRIVLGSGVDRRLMFAKRNAAGYVQPAPDAKAIEDYLASEQIDLAIFDPFVEMHEANENDNPEVAVVGAVFRRVAVKANCAVILAHHTRKPPAASASDAYAGNMDTARGAGSLAGVARMVATLYTIDKETGKRYGIPEDECRRYVRFDDAKANMSLVSGEPMFFRREGVVIGGEGGEEVGVLRPADLKRGKDAKTAARDDLVTDALEIMGARVAMPIGDIAKDLTGLPMYADKTAHALRLALKRAFEKKQQINENEQIGIIVQGIPGRPGATACLVRSALTSQKDSERTRNKPETSSS
ncbi:AAA family ATPase [Bradyrhizobium stylosanthis]|uniref:Bifunctional DNA primase/polymerase-like protein n=1 Tax=Bradyrhizobium stylosanthis TaxID=1803665 RepID=A0A560CXK0_9BRAD|nr:AAA family ATPase [Bradyrhizobium stylosanthis]TWA89561.1 bifunctional DNA primase/polymerase-like protein [Bradyrhizobium stylosanthis]